MRLGRLLLVFVQAAGGCLDFPPRIVPADSGAAGEDVMTPPPDAGPSACFGWNGVALGAHQVEQRRAGQSAACLLLTRFPEFL